MTKQNINIVNFNLLYEILNEIKEDLSFNIIKFEKEIDFVNDKNEFKDSLTITGSNNNLSGKNVLILNNLPIPLPGLLELININLIKLRFNLQSQIKIKDYVLNLNTKFISQNGSNLKLTEKEIVQRSLAIAADICVYTNQEIIIEEIKSKATNV